MRNDRPSRMQRQRQLQRPLLHLKRMELVRASQSLLSQLGIHLRLLEPLKNERSPLQLTSIRLLISTHPLQVIPLILILLLPDPNHTLPITTTPAHHINSFPPSSHRILIHLPISQMTFKILQTHRSVNRLMLPWTLHHSKDWVSIL
jgi:hypothetical protein